MDRMGSLFAEGKGLDKALTDHLDEQKARIERIERGEEIQAFRIIPQSADVADEAQADRDNEDDFKVSRPAARPAPAEDDIPF